MAGLADFSVPSYLQPPSPAQKQQLDIERGQLEMQQAEMLQKGFEKMQKRVTMAKVVGDANVLQASGMDPEEARSLAVLHHGQALFDTPEEWNKVSTELEDAISRKRALKAFKEDVEKGMARTDENGQHPDPNEILTEAWMKHGAELSGKGFAPFVTSQTRAAIAAKTLQERRDEFLKREERLKTRDEEISKLRERGLGIQAGMLEQRKTEEAGRGKRFEEGEKGKQERSRAELLLKAQKDPKLIQIKKDLTEVERSLADATAYPRFWKSKPENLKKGVQQLKAQRDERLKELGLEPGTSVTTGGETPVAASKQGQAVRLGTLVEQGGKRYRYQGGDVNDPQSWVEVK